MSDDAATPAPARKRAARVPGDSPADDAATPADAVEAKAEAAPPQRHSLPDFRHKSAAAARRWFEENPNVIRRAVLTHEGWYVHPDTFKGATRADV